VELGVELFGCAQHAKPIARRQLQVGEDDGGTFLPELFDRLGLKPVGRRRQELVKEFVNMVKCDEAMLVADFNWLASITRSAQMWHPFKCASAAPRSTSESSLSISAPIVSGSK